jgi:predicted ATPase/GAF domain-containing protein
LAAMTDLSSYAFETVWNDGEFVLSKIARVDDSSPVLVLTPAVARPAPGSVARLEHACTFRNELDPAWAARPVELIRHRGQPALLIEDHGGDVLARMLGKPWDLEPFLRIAVGLAVALGRFHQRGLVHKDIKPANIFVNIATGEAWLSGFGLASQLARERQTPDRPAVISGTLAYMAPEQTGRMNRSIDSRSDLYSLGVTYYEMLTGELPFTASEPMEWIHCHVAMHPAPPGERVNGIPAAISGIVSKLLSKNAEDRYQTATGIEADLRKCLSEWDSQRRIDPFPPGTHDVPDRLLIPERLYGREGDVKTLLTAFDRVVTGGAPELVLVSGYSGIGKSSVVNELHKALVPPRALFASGKFDQYKRDIPYATLAQAFEHLVRSILGLSELELGHWRDDIRQALGPNGQLIVNLIPQLEVVIGRQPPVPDLPPQDAQNRFQMVFRRFISVFARPEHPLALFLDDLQWLDAATLDLFEHLVTAPELHHLLLVGAYRDNEVDSAHPLMRRLDAVHQSGARVHQIVLAPLGLDDLRQLITDTLHCERERAQPLAQLVEEKTSGNPFFAIQFIAELSEEGLIAFDREAQGWTWNLSRIRAKNYTDNVVDLMVGKLNRLSRGTQDALKQLACLGSRAQTDTLGMICGQSEEEIHGALCEAVRAGLVFRLDDAYAFLHDRVREAGYSLIPERERAAVHLRIARLFSAHTSPDKRDELIFEIVNQFNFGTVHITDWSEKEQVAELNLCAGRRAKAATAYASACTFLSIATALLGDEGWTSRYELTFAVWLERTECEFLGGNVEIAERLIRVLLSRGASKLDKAAAYRVKIDLHVVKRQTAQAIETALECLRLFGIDMSARPAREQVQAEYDRVWTNLAGRPIESLIDLPLMTDPEMQAAMRVLSLLWTPTNSTNAELSYLNCCQMVNLTLQHGVTDAAALGYGWFGMIIVPVFGRYTDGYRFGKLACDLVEKYNFQAYNAKTYLAMEIIALWTQPIATAMEYLRSALCAGDPVIACYGHNHIVTNILLRGDPLEQVWLESERGLEFDRRARFREAADIIVSQQRFILNMQGRTLNFSSFSDLQFEEGTFEAQLISEATGTTLCWYWIIKLQSRFFSGDYKIALAASRKARELLWSSVGMIQLVDYHYYTALAIAAIYNTASPDSQRAWREELKTHVEQLREWAENGSATFLDKFELVSSEVARVHGRELDAERLYEQAIQSAREQGFIHNEGLAYELAARFYAARGFEVIAHTYLRNARYCYFRWGALGKVKQLDQLYPQRQEDRVPISANATIATPIGQLDVATIVRASQALSGEIVLFKLIESLMRIAVEHAGAERGLFILLRGAEQQIEAEANTAQGRVEVTLREAAVTPSELPESILQYVIRTRESVILDDASVRNLFSEDEYVREKSPKSVFCLPVIKQAKLIGALYLENNLTPRAFTSDRIAVLELLSVQAAISLENALLYSDLQRSETYLAEAQRLTHTGTWAFYPSNLEDNYWSAEIYRIFGLDPATDRACRSVALERVHPDDRARVDRAVQDAIRKKANLDISSRVVLPDGTMKHVHTVGYPVFDQAGEVVEMVGISMDVTEQYQNRAALEKAFEEIRDLKDQLYRENLALRDEVDRTSMFEEIVGTSTALQAVLARIAKVAPTDSTVLITGETGTGKELIARAVHKRSQRSGRAFVSVNCAALAPSLISSELFGHERGAFTGATQRRLGRFELADGGTIFLDEVGELPPDTQVALLRVLQEREFERVGGARSIQVDVRVIAATNRDLNAATANGTFRLDLFYRLNVFPIEVPPLRERKDDILMLLEYFVKRYASQAGKNIRSIDKKTLELFQSYEWPGNIRELQNVIERSVIVSSGSVFSIDEYWLSKESSQPASRVHASRPVETDAPGEREIIEAVLAESRGRVSGPSGAAAKLGIPRSTLESRIKALKIRKTRFKFG